VFEEDGIYVLFDRNVKFLLDGVFTAVDETGILTLAETVTVVFAGTRTFSVTVFFSVTSLGT
jgi:hypothetical protein